MTYFSQQSAEGPEPKLVGFLGFDGVSSFDLLGAFEAFAAARTTDSASRPCYETLIIGVGNKTFLSDSGATIKAHEKMENAPSLDTIIIPGGTGLRAPEASRQIAAWLLERAARTRRMAAISAGIYPLARTGLLDGRLVTTHWRLAHDVARAFPALSVSNAASFMKTGTFYTCCGGIAGMEMSLALIAEDFGAKTAFAVARELSIDLRPPGDEQATALPQYQPGPADRLAELPAWISSRLHRNLTVDVLAERACLSPRQFYRLFKRDLQMHPRGIRRATPNRRSAPPSRRATRKRGERSRFGGVQEPGSLPARLRPATRRSAQQLPATRGRAREQRLMTPKRIGLIGFEQVTALHLVGPADAFSAATLDNGYGGRIPCYEVWTLGLRSERFQTESGLSFTAQATLQTAPDFDTIIVAGGPGIRRPGVSEEIAEWLLQRAAQTRRFGAVCAGIYGLAPTGLLDGREVTTHWRFASDVARRFPRLKVGHQRPLVQDGPFYTSTGLSAGLNLSLALIQED